QTCALPILSKLLTIVDSRWNIHFNSILTVNCSFTATGFTWMLNNHTTTMTFVTSGLTTDHAQHRLLSNCHITSSMTFITGNWMCTFFTTITATSLTNFASSIADLGLFALNVSHKINCQ